jgi:hypothetical protein
VYVLCKKDPKHKQVRRNVDCFMIALTCRDKDRPLITTCMFIRLIEPIYAASQVSLTDAHMASTDLSKSHMLPHVTRICGASAHICTD